jgi:hypothetical protein
VAAARCRGRVGRMGALRVRTGLEELGSGGTSRTTITWIVSPRLKLTDEITYMILKRLGEPQQRYMPEVIPP